MKSLILIVLLSFVSSVADSQNERVLQPIMEMYGTTKYEEMGKFVTGIPAGTNLPFRAAIYRGYTFPGVTGSTGHGYTYFYRLQTPTDTTLVLKLKGQNATIGDLNGDGFQDIVLVAPRDSVANDTVFIYWGTATGVDTLNPTRIGGEYQFDGFGTSMAIGQLVGDSTADLIVCAPSFPAGRAQGRAYIYQGSSQFSTTPKVVLTGDSLRYGLGIACAIGDLNNDGSNDLAIRGLFQYGADSARWHYVDIWYGGTTFDTTRSLRFRNQFGVWGDVKIFDVNGDHIPDLLWSTYDTARTVFVHYGRKDFTAVPDLKLVNPGVGSFAYTIANAGDMNGDGYDDIAVGADYASITSGFVFIYPGGPRIDGKYHAGVGRSTDSFFGQSISSLGDIDGDGLADIIIGASQYAFEDGRGYWGIFKGDSTILVTDVKKAPNYQGSIPKHFDLLQSYPNPFNPTATIVYELAKSAFITLRVYDLLGKEIKVLVNEQKTTGRYRVNFDGAGFPSGTYFYELVARTNDGTQFTKTKTMSLIK